VLVINKAARLAVQGGSKGERHLDGMLHCFSSEKGGERARLVHRLDRDTSGCLVLGRTRHATAELARAFKEGKACKTYLAIVASAPPHSRGTVSLPLVKKRGHGDDEGAEKVYVAQSGDFGPLSAITDYLVVERSASSGAALLRLSPRTGRTHQLRVHCASGLDASIVGDVKYGFGQESTSLLAATLRSHLDKDRVQLCLHAWGIELEWAEGHIACTAPIPSHMLQVAALLGLDLSSLSEHDTHLSSLSAAVEPPPRAKGAPPL